MIRNFKIKDIAPVMTLLDRCRPHVLAHHEYVYWMLSTYHSSTCFVSVEDNLICGFLSALQSIEESTAFIWQICVDPEHRKNNIALKMLLELEKSLHNGMIKNIQLSIATGNTPSLRLFEKFSEMRKLSFAETGTMEIAGSLEHVYLITPEQR